MRQHGGSGTDGGAKAFFHGGDGPRLWCAGAAEDAHRLGTIAAKILAHRDTPRCSVLVSSVRHANP